MNVIPLYGPDREHVLRLGDRTEYRFIVAYHYNGRERSFDILATDWADAEAQVARIRDEAVVEGQVYAEVEA